MALTRPLTRPLVGALTRGLTQAGAGGSVAVPPPAGFGTVPFSATFAKSGSTYSTDFDPTVYRLVEGAGGVSTYYVDKAAGLDTNPGTSGSPFKTIYKAILVSRATAPNMLIRVKGGNYYLTENFNNKVPEATNLSVVSWDGLPVYCTNENPNITPASWTLDGSSTYYASVAGYGFSPNRSSAWDGSSLDAFGDDIPLTPAASIAACKAAAGTYFTDLGTSRIYVHTFDNRAPDVNIHVYEAWGNPGQYRDYPGAPANGQCYFENIHFRGGSIAFTTEQTHATNTTTAVFNGCTFKYGGINPVAHSVYAIGNIDIAYVDCLGAASHADVFSYVAYGANPAPRALEVNCEARRGGCILVGTANQGSTMHDGGKIVRLNGNYHDNENDQVADVSASTKTWMMGCVAGDGLKVNYASYLCGNGSGGPQMWLDGCTSSGQTYDLTAGAGATIYTRDFTGGATNSGSGTVTTY